MSSTSPSPNPNPNPNPNPSLFFEEDNDDEFIPLSFEFHKPCNCRKTKILHASRRQLISETESLVIISQLLDQIKDQLPHGIHEDSNLVKYVYHCMAQLPKGVGRIFVYFGMEYHLQVDGGIDTNKITLQVGCGWVIGGVAKQLDESKEEQVCAICLDDLLLGNQVSCLPCKHVFHKECIHKWVDKADSCPLCRSYLGQICDTTLHLKLVWCD